MNASQLNKKLPAFYEFPPQGEMLPIGRSDITYELFAKTSLVPRFSSHANNFFFRTASNEKLGGAWEQGHSSLVAMVLIMCRVKGSEKSKPESQTVSLDLLQCQSFCGSGSIGANLIAFQKI